MVIEVDYLGYRRDKVIEEKSETVLPGSYKKFRELRPSNDVTVYLTNDNTRGILVVKGLKNIYAIKYYGEDDIEGEIVDLTTKDYIELNQGEEVSVIKNRGNSGKEMWFYLSGSSGNMQDITFPTETVPFKK